MYAPGYVCAWLFWNSHPQGLFMSYVARLGQLQQRTPGVYSRGLPTNMTECGLKLSSIILMTVEGRYPPPLLHIPLGDIPHRSSILNKQHVCVWLSFIKITRLLFHPQRHFCGPFKSAEHLTNPPVLLNHPNTILAKTHRWLTKRRFLWWASFRTLDFGHCRSRRWF